MPRATVVRLLTVLAVVALFASDLFRGVHLLTTRHVLCPEHGEFVHADEGGGPRSRDGVRAVSLHAAGEGHHHDHCELAATRGADAHAVLPAARLVVASPSGDELARAPAARAAFCRAVLAYAPKLSPPV